MSVWVWVELKYSKENIPETPTVFKLTLMGQRSREGQIAFKPPPQAFKPLTQEKTQASPCLQLRTQQALWGLFLTPFVEAEG